MEHQRQGTRSVIEFAQQSGMSIQNQCDLKKLQCATKSSQTFARKILQAVHYGKVNTLFK